MLGILFPLATAPQELFSTYFTYVLGGKLQKILGETSGKRPYILGVPTCFIHDTVVHIVPLISM